MTNAPAPDPSQPTASPAWGAPVSPTGAVVVRTYTAKRQAEAAIAFQADARYLDTLGYSPVSQSWADGRSGCLRIILLGFIGALVIKPAGALTVTYQRRA